MLTKINPTLFVDLATVAGVALIATRTSWIVRISTTGGELYHDSSEKSGASAPTESLRQDFTRIVGLVQQYQEEKFLHPLIADVESRHFRTEADTGANECAMLVWNQLRNFAGLPNLTKAGLPTYCEVCKAYHTFDPMPAGEHRRRGA